MSAITLYPEMITEVSAAARAFLAVLSVGRHELEVAGDLCHVVVPPGRRVDDHLPAAASLEVLEELLQGGFLEPTTVNPVRYKLTEPGYQKARALLHAS